MAVDNKGKDVCYSSVKEIFKLLCVVDGKMLLLKIRNLEPLSC